jgi:hypothetical protein
VVKNPLKLVAPVFADPSDLALRSVVADALLQQQHPWGTLIAVQLGTKKGPAGKQRERVRDARRAAPRGARVRRA